MKLLDVAIKDLVQSSRSLMVYIFAFVIPILVTALFVVMFGGIGGDDESFALPSTTVVVVNLDEGQMPAGSNADAGAFADLGLDMPQGAETDVGAAESFGDVLSMILKSEVFADFMVVSDEVDESAARAAVDNQEAGVAVIIPANFTSAMLQPDETADVVFYQDPTLLLGPAIVESIMRQLLDSFSAGTIAIGVAIEGLLESGIVPDQALISDLVNQVASGQTGEGEQPSELLEIRLPPGTESSGSIVTEIVGVILGGMMVFFVFYTAAAAVQTILLEEERGTLARLFTTPTSHFAILGGKTLAGVFTVIIQMTVLMLLGALLFSIFWGDLPTVLLAVAGIILVSAATGLFLTSLMQNTRQGGFIFGGVLTVTGMLGLIPVFTAGVPNQPESLQTVSLLVPQGWAMRGLTISMDGGTVVDILPIFAGLLAWTVVLGFIGQRRLQKRFA